jgi:NAD+ synthase (glutamine-hydrolysing)
MRGRISEKWCQVRIAMLPSIGLLLHQFSPRLRDTAHNAACIAKAAGAGGDLLLTPELALTGYDLRDDAVSVASPLTDGEPPGGPGAALGAALAAAGGPLVVCGLVERGRRGIPYNTAAVLERGRLLGRHRKIYLPTYGMFDEARYFGRGRRVRVFEYRGWRLGVLICEDFWHPGLSYVLAAAGIDALFVQAAAPGRGVWEGGEESGWFRSAEAWTLLACATALQYGIYVALSNRTGVEAGVTFAGGSLVVGPDGAVVAQADETSETLLAAELSAEALARARRPYAHDRDDDPALVRAELRRLALAR